LPSVTRLSRNDRLRHLLRQLQRAQFGRRSEKLDPRNCVWRLRNKSLQQMPACSTRLRGADPGPLLRGIWYWLCWSKKRCGRLRTYVIYASSEA
jgi:Transposase C of IS166 homeodomain